MRKFQGRDHQIESAIIFIKFLQLPVVPWIPVGRFYILALGLEGFMKTAITVMHIVVFNIDRLKGLGHGNFADL